MVSCSEDGKVFFWDLVEVSLPLVLLVKGISSVFPMLEKSDDRYVNWGPLAEGEGVCLTL